ncbi:glycosyltransferase [Nodosilinea sp. LEGE 06152]|uniref:glycosyltransferase n=1 Tax=Nodosilinea sp. LEGE 06152 TaxID=2777966 RepID=UPI0018821891|nr:glycosyltransferase [Nodosilinea sp. LEGE 06152]MBE9157095.1 glycosyltransferase [Nodosilinea sp. LEGE 06152]
MSGAAAVLADQVPLKRNRRMRLRDRTLLFRYLVVVNLILGGWYLYWRVTQSINGAVLWLAIPLLAAEIYMYFGGVLFLVGLWRPIERQVRSLGQLMPPLPRDQYPTVDVFITCYNEPADIVEQTALAALALDYPVTQLRVYILDDGNSPELRQLSERLCLTDLQSPPLQAATAALDAQRNALVARLHQVQALQQDIAEVEAALSHHRLQVPSRPEVLPEVMAWFDQVRPVGVPDSVWLGCQTALGEGFDNVLCHAHRHLPAETPIDLEVAILNHVVLLRLWDRGSPFDLEGHLLTHTAVDDWAERGRGLNILRQTVDDLAYFRGADDRNCLVLIKRYAPQRQETPAHESDPYQLLGQLHSLHQLLLLNQPEQPSVTAMLKAQVQSLQADIDRKHHQLADMARCRYIARVKPQGRPHHAKAGNINHALFSGETHGDFVLTLDADHIPKPQFLQRVLPYFFEFNLDRGQYDGNRVAFVQTPQAFYNLPPGDPFGHDAHLFYGPIQQGKDGMNSAFYTGTNAILRREALVNMGLQHFATDFAKDDQRLAEFDLIGGLSSISITEDMNTAMRLHSVGWRSVYHSEVLAEGLAPDDLSSTLKQKLRWAQGTIQVMLRDNPLLKPGLSFWQRLQYFQTMYSYFVGFFIAVFLASPIIFFFTGLIPVDSFGPQFALHFVPAYVVNRLTFVAASWGIPLRELWRNEQYAIALFPLYIQAVWSVFTGQPIKFQVTPKQRQAGVYLGLVRVQLVFFGLTLAGMLWGLVQLGLGHWSDPWVYLINSLWALYHLALLWVIIRAAWWQPKTPI